MIAIGIAIFIILALVYVALPLWAKLIILALNSAFPDPIPILDEVLMIAAVISDIIKIYKGMVVAEWIRTHKAVSAIIAVGSILLIVFIIYSFVR